MGRLTLVSMQQCRQHICVQYTQMCVDYTHNCVYCTQMKARKITTTDVCKVTGYSRHQLRGLLAELPVYSGQKTEARVAREFTHADLVTLAVVHTLETSHRARRDAVASISNLLRKALTGPKTVNRGARLLISYEPPAVSYLTSESLPQDGTLVSLGPIFQRVDTYMGHGRPYTEKLQTEFSLGPTLVSSRKKATQ